MTFAEYLRVAHPGDILEFWQDAYRPARKIRASVIRYLIFPDHVQVAQGTFGARVDAENFIRIYRRKSK